MGRSLFEIHRLTQRRQFHSQRILINSLQKPMPQLTMHLHSRTNDSISRRISLFKILSHQSA